jgi:hypothetical protein
MRIIKQLGLLSFLLLGAFFYPHQAQAQQAAIPTAQLHGKLAENKDNGPVVGATVQLVSKADSTQRRITVSDVNGKFGITRIRSGEYSLRISFTGFKPISRDISVSRDSINLGTITMEEDTKVLGEVTVKGQEIRAEQKGDTLVYNAAAFKVNQDATAEDLVRKMPGITIENGQVQAQGQAVRRVLLDGQEFLGDDATAALRNLPAEIVRNVQVFDRQSDQASFTGFDDGNAERTINIMTTGGVTNAQFGKIYAGNGTDSRYNAGGNLSWFDGQQRISVIGLSNNMNQQNFSMQDLLGIMGGGGMNFGGAGGGRGGAPQVVVMGGGGGGGGASFNFGGGGFGDFFTGQQAGINKTHSLGFNYSNRFSTKLNVNASYFFNQSNNNSNNSFDRTYFGEDVVAQFYNESSISKTQNGNHRLNARITWTIDPKNSFIISPRLNTQNNSSDRSNSGTTMQDLFTMLNSTQNVTSSNTSGLNGGGNILYRRGFDKRGRTLSLNVNTNFNNRDSESTQQSLNRYYGAGMNGSDIIQRIDQMTMSPTDNSTWSGSINYTEPVGTKSQFQFNYSPSFNYSYSDRYTYGYDQSTLAYTRVDSILSNEFDNKNFTQRGGLSYRYNFQKLNFNIGANYQNLRLVSEQLFPVDFYGSTSFNSIQPDAVLQYRFAQNSQLRIQYRASTRAPSISQLQNVIDNSNPLRLTSGNPDLDEQYTHNVNIRYNLTRVSQGQSFLVFSNVNVSNNFLGSSNFTASRDTLLAEGVLLRRGAQYIRPENLGQQQSFVTFANFGFPFKPLKSNLSMNLRTTISRSPSLINNTNFYSTNTGVSPGLNLSSTISPQVDFNVSYRVNFSSVSYEQPNLSNSSYNQQTGTFQFTWTPWNKLVFVTDFAFNRYDGLGEDIDQNQSVLNAAIGYKFLKKNAGELRLTGFDLFNQNKNINRQITDSYIQDNLTQSLTRYFVVTFTYNLRNFNTASTPSRPMEMGMPGGVRMERWGN